MFIKELWNTVPETGKAVNALSKFVTIWGMTDLYGLKGNCLICFSLCIQQIAGQIYSCLDRWTGWQAHRFGDAKIKTGLTRESGKQTDIEKTK